MKIYPAILSDSLAVVSQQIEMAQDLDDVSTIHFDIIDGRFAENLTISPADLIEFSFEPLDCDFHLMTEEPLDFVNEIIEFKANLPVRAVIGQLERMSHQDHFLEEVEKHGWLPGLSLDVYTPLEAIDDDSWEFLKVVQLMAVEAGSQGQDFHPAVLEKIKELKKMIALHEAEVEIIIDGGVNSVTIEKITTAGADGVAVGSSLWEAVDRNSLVQALQQA